MRVCEGQGVEMCNGHELATTHPSLHTACPYQAACHGVRIRIRYLRGGSAGGIHTRLAASAFSRARLPN